MKKLLNTSVKVFFIVIVITSNIINVYGQSKRGYIRALEYILKNHADEKIVVSDTIIRLDFSNFTEDLSSYWKKKNTTAVFSYLDSVDQSNNNCAKKLSFFSGKHFPGHSPLKIVYFSPFFGNMVIGEILESQYNDVGLNHNAQAPFNGAIDYLFIFDNKNNLKKVFKANIQYN